jgi:hypothetical protein
MKRTIPLDTEPTKFEEGPSRLKDSMPNKESRPRDASITTGEGCRHQSLAFGSVGAVPNVSCTNTGSPLLIGTKSVCPARITMVAPWVRSTLPTSWGAPSSAWSSSAQIP